MRFGVVLFPGSNCSQDAIAVARQVSGVDPASLWHKDADLCGVDAVILPGGFSYGDALRCGAIARFSPIMEEVRRFASRGGPVIGICNGFQVLTEAGLLPGALLRNQGLTFVCEDVRLVVANGHLPFTGVCPETIIAPIAHHDGCYYADAETLARLEGEGRVAFRYCDRNGEVTAAANPNGSLHNIAGIVNARGNVLGMMPHPERNADVELGDASGASVFRSLVRAVLEGAVS